MTTVTFTGNFDNGRGLYQVDTSIDVDTSKDYLTAEEVVEIVEELRRADRRLHGRSYRGCVIGFQISNEELDKQQDMGNITLEDGSSEYIYSDGFEWLNTFNADSKDIRHSFDVTNY
ncbi:TPA: hypothetical protein U1B39_001406 [Streptococcus suis]|nr:hypothetical protein [Streptococcus suis]